MSGTEQLYVLYGSQMGNSEGAAKEFCETLQAKYTPDFFKQQNLPPIEVKTTCIQLDDFLEMNHADYTKCLVIFVSSYGMGQAPLGAYRFRELCDEFLSEGMEKILSGLQYALCGLGDSSYPTYLKNPTTIDKGLTAVGAKRIGEMGKGDASAMGEKSQDKVVKKWSQDILVPLAKALADETEVDTSKMQSKTIPLLMKIDPDYISPHQGEKKSGMLPYIGLGAVLIGAAAAILASR